MSDQLTRPQGWHPVDAYSVGKPFDANWAGPPELRPRVYRTQAEKDIWYGCVVENEYRLPELKAEDVVIDIGAHIGAFSYLAHLKGSRHIYAFEIDPWHVEAAAVNLGDMVKAQEVGLYHGAVVRSDEHRAKAYHYDGAWNSFGLLGPPVQSFSLDEILDQVVDPVRFLKIDCEGGEWPILGTCTKLDRIQEIAGEYHLVSDNVPELDDLPLVITTDGLRGHLMAAGFEVEIVQHSESTGNFFCKRRLTFSGADFIPVQPVEERKSIADRLRAIADELDGR